MERIIHPDVAAMVRLSPSQFELPDRKYKWNEISSNYFLFGLSRVAFGIAIGSSVNLAIAAWNHATDTDHAPRDNQIQALRQILGAPFVPAVVLLIALFWCMESPRYYMQPNTPHRNPSRAYEILLNARQTKVDQT